MHVNIDVALIAIFRIGRQEGKLSAIFYSYRQMADGGRQSESLDDTSLIVVHDTGVVIVGVFVLLGCLVICALIHEVSVHYLCSTHV